MAKETERKFLVNGDSWRNQDEGVLYRQGYIRTKGKVTVRVRIAGDTGYLTIKGPTTGISRPEFEYRIPLEDAQILLDSICDKPLIEKRRYRLKYKGMIWEVDEFLSVRNVRVFCDSISITAFSVTIGFKFILIFLQNGHAWTFAFLFDHKKTPQRLLGNLGCWLVTKRDALARLEGGLPLFPR